MKRMSEVFKLPVDCSMFEVSGYQPVKARTVGNSCEADDYAAHAINNIDALADALESALPTLKYNRSISDSADKLYLDALSALTAYRGAK